MKKSPRESCCNTPMACTQHGKNQISIAYVSQKYKFSYLPFVDCHYSTSFVNNHDAFRIAPDVPDGIGLLRSQDILVVFPCRPQHDRVLNTNVEMLLFAAFVVRFRNPLP